MPTSHRFNFIPSRKIELAVLQPTSYCNLNCTYCYLPGRQSRNVMTDSVLNEALKKILQSPLTSSELILLWHAGEPLAAGVEFYRNANRRIAQYRPPQMRLVQSVQTNGTLIDDSWCELFAEHQFHVGVSLDGPEFLHDRHRRNWADRGTFRRTMAGIERLSSYGIQFGVLAVVTQDTLEHADTIYDFFKSVGASSVAFNVEEVENAHTTSTFEGRDLSLTRAAYETFFSRLLDRVAEDPDPLQVREFRRLAKVALRLRRDSSYVYEPMEAAPLRLITILSNGDVTPFSPELATAKAPLYADFTVGNICVEPLDMIAARLATSALNADISESRVRCQQTCKYFQWCGGTYYSNKWSEHGTLLATETVACRLHVHALTDAFTDHLRTRSHAKAQTA